MTRISIYSKDVNVTGNDRWIGSDAQNQNRTKNFTPDNVATYFNENQVIDLGVELRYFYDTLDPLQQRVYGSITFETEIGPQVNFSAISTFILSKYTMGHTDVSQFLDFLIGSNVLLSRANNINMFGYYKIDNIEPYLPDPNFFVVTLTFDAGNGYMKEDEDYFISLVQFEQAAPSTPTLQTVTDEGNVTTNSMIIENYNTIYTTTLAANEVNVDYDDGNQHAYSIISAGEVSTNYINPSSIFSFAKLFSDGYLELGIDNKVGTLNVGDLTNSITLKFPNKPLGSYTIATTEDITVPTLQSVTDEGNTTTNDVVVDSALYESVISNNYINVATKLSITGVALTSSGVISFGNGSAYSYLSSDATNLNVNFKLPNKVSGTYTLATTADVPASLLVALPFTTDHLTATNNPYVIGDVVWYLGNVYRCIANNDSILPTATAYWTNLGAGYPLVQQPTDWSSTSGNNQILNKPTIPTGTVTSVDLTMPSAFTVTGNPVTTSGTLAVTGAGVVSQYVRGDGSLANFPTSTGGGASVSYYLNGSVSQGTIGGVAYKEMNSVPVIGTGTDFTINADGYIAQFITDVGDPNKLLIPGGNWNFETYFSASSGGGSPRFYIELYKYDGATFTLIASNSATPENITGGTSIDLYFTALAVPTTTLLVTDRLAVRFYVIHSGRTITMHTENSHLSQIITTFSSGLTALNGLTAQVQSFATGTSGTDFGISSATSTHTFNLPTASAANRGALSSTDWSTFNDKQAALGFTPENVANKQNSLALDGTAAKYTTVDAVNNLSFIDKFKRGIQYFTDFDNTATSTPNFTQFQSGAGATVIRSVSFIPNQTSNQIGFCQYQTGTTATGYATHINEGQVGRQFCFGGGAWVFETFINVEVLSDATNRFRFVTGFGSSPTTASDGNAAIFTYDEGGTQNGTIASPNWQCVTSVSDVRTLTTTTTAVSANTWTKLRIEVNAAGTSATFYVNGTLVATHTTNIPTFISAANNRGFNVKQSILKSIGTTNRSVFCDYLGYENRLTTIR